MNRTPLFIVFEGLDLCGKTTVSQAVAQRLDARWLKTPDEAFDDFRANIDDAFQGSGMAQQLFYSSCVVHASRQVEGLRQKQRHVVLDRYIASTLAYDTVARHSGMPDAFWGDNVFNCLRQPDVVFFIETADEVRRERAELRKTQGATDRISMEKSCAIQKRYQDVFALFPHWKVHYVDNSGEKRDCIDKCIRLLGCQGTD